MKKVILRTVFVLLAFNVISYWLLSDSYFECEVGKKYIEFSERRLKNEWAIDTNEYILVSSCGDELFRNLEVFEKAVFQSNPRNKGKVFEAQLPLAYSDGELSQTVNVVKKDIDVLGAIGMHTDNSGSNVCVVYQGCVQRSVPVLMKRVEFQFFYSSNPTDFHAMFHNEQMEECTSTYVWLLGNWIELGGAIDTFSEG